MTKKISNVTTDLAVFGAVIARLREAHQPPIPQIKLAEMMGLSPSAWSRVEKGETQLSASQLRLLSKTFGISSDRIFELVDEAVVGLQAKGIAVKSFAYLKSLSKSSTSNGLSASAIAGLAASGIVPVLGPMLGGVIGGLGLFVAAKIKQHQENKE